MNEHQKNINKKHANKSSMSVISEHRINYNHKIDWEGVEILDEKKFYKKRLTSETLHIKRQKSGLNKQSDTDFLSESYIPILNLLPSL